MRSMNESPATPRHRPVEIAPETWVIQATIGEGVAPQAIHMNSMVIRAEEPVVVDTGCPIHRDQYFEDLFGLARPTRSDRERPLDRREGSRGGGGCGHGPRHRGLVAVFVPPQSGIHLGVGRMTLVRTGRARRTRARQSLRCRTDETV